MTSGLCCYIWPGVYNYSLKQPSKIIITFITELIEIIIINLHRVITNEATIMDSVLEVINKDPDKMMVLFGNILQYLGVY